MVYTFDVYLVVYSLETRTNILDAGIIATLGASSKLKCRLLSRSENRTNALLAEEASAVKTLFGLQNEVVADFAEENRRVLEGAMLAQSLRLHSNYQLIMLSPL